MENPLSGAFSALSPSIKRFDGLPKITFSGECTLATRRVGNPIAMEKPAHLKR
jgi:hypothetical protein